MPGGINKANPAQRKAVMAKLNQSGVRDKPIRIDVSKNFYRARIRNPTGFSKLRWKDVGKPGHTRIIVGRLKGKTTTTTQSVIIPKRDIRIPMMRR